MFRPRAPIHIVMSAAYGLLAIAVVVVFVALRMPSAGLQLEPRGPTVAVSLRGAASRTIAADTPIVFSSRDEAVTFRAKELVPDFEPNGNPREIAAWYQAHDRLSGIVRSGDGRARIGSGATVPLHGGGRGLRDLSLDVWLLLVQAVGIGLLGAWIAVSRPRDWGARFYFAACAGIAVAGFSGALYDARELTAAGGLLRWMLALNFAGSAVAGAGLVSLYLVQPRRLIDPIPILVFIVLAGAWGAACGWGLLPLVAFYGALVTFSLGFPLVLAVQWIAARGDIGVRTALRWVGATTLAGSGFLSLAMAAPWFAGTAPIATDGMSIVPLFIVYGAIAFGIGHSRLFDLERWTYRVIVGALAAVGLLALDAVLIGLVGFRGGIAFAIALLVAGFLYLPVRSLVWRRIVGGPPLSDTELVQTATEVAFAPTAEGRRRGWRGLLSQLFDPLEVEALDTWPAQPAVSDDGASLTLPAVADDSALRLRHRAGGRRLFGPDQVVLAREVVSLMRRAENTREEYARGVSEERQRIARDLHDDVGARLLTGLHREDVASARSDIRQAMAEIRAMIGSLGDERISLSRVMADLRFETAERLAVADILLDWPPPAEERVDRMLDHAAYKALVSSHREVVSNIVKHSGARTVRITTCQSARAISIWVRDDGRGMSADAPSGHGLINMRRRVGQLKGRFEITNSAAGVAIEMTIPISEVAP